MSNNLRKIVFLLSEEQPPQLSNVKEKEDE